MLVSVLCLVVIGCIWIITHSHCVVAGLVSSNRIIMASGLDSSPVLLLVLSPARSVCLAVERYVQFLAIHHANKSATTILIAINDNLRPSCQHFLLFLLCIYWQSKYWMIFILHDEWLDIIITHLLWLVNECILLWVCYLKFFESISLIIYFHLKSSH